VISATVGGATEPLLPSHTRSGYACALFFKISCWFYVNSRPFTVFVMAFFKVTVTVTQNFSLLEATAESRCVVGGESVVCKVVNFVVLLKWWKQ
jgi:hypothetical protein